MTNLKLLPLTVTGMLLILASCGARQQSHDSLKESPKTIALGSKAIVNGIDWSDISDLNKNTQIAEMASTVGLISIPAMSSRCTGFLVSPNVVMTNWHCFPHLSMVRGARFYPRYLQGQTATDYTRTPSYDCSELLVTHEALDLALIRCNGRPGQEHGIVELEESRQHIFSEKEIYVIHQNCNYHGASTKDCAPTKKYSAGEVQSPRAGANPNAMRTDLFYTADTLGGSSGSPVFSADTHKVVALHHNGHGKTRGSGGHGTQNSGVPMNLIVEFIGEKLPEMQWGEDSSAYNGLAANGFRPTPSPAQRPTPKPSPQGDRFQVLPLQKALRGLINFAGDQDVYQLNIPQSILIQVQLEFSHQQGDLELKLYDSTGELLAESTSSKNYELIRGQIQAGTYYVKVYGHQKAQGAYRLAALIDHN